MASTPTSPSESSGGNEHHDWCLSTANITRIMKKSLPANGQISKEAEEAVQACLSEFISFITSEANDICQRGKRKRISGDDVFWAMTKLQFDPFSLYSALCRVSEKAGSTTGDGDRREEPGGLLGPNMRFAQSEMRESTIGDGDREEAWDLPGPNTLHEEMPQFSLPGSVIFVDNHGHAVMMSP